SDGTMTIAEYGPDELRQFLLSLLYRYAARLPLFPQLPTFLHRTESVAMGQGTKSLRDSPLREAACLRAR
ncbi:MAG: hypothetical protein WAM40_03715, partial [Xanthobacteraceae bacterium]